VVSGRARSRRGGTTDPESSDSRSHGRARRWGKHRPLAAPSTKKKYLTEDKEGPDCHYPRTHSAHTHTCAGTHTHARRLALSHALTHAHTHAHPHTHTHTHACTRAQTHIQGGRERPFPDTHTHTHIHTHTHAHMHVLTRARSYKHGKTSINLRRIPLGKK